MAAGEVAIWALVLVVGAYVVYGENLVRRHRSECREQFEHLVGQRVIVTLSGRVRWTVNGVVDSVDERNVWLRNDQGVSDRLPLTIISEVEPTHVKPLRESSGRVKFREQPFWRTTSTWPRARMARMPKRRR